MTTPVADDFSYVETTEFGFGVDHTLSLNARWDGCVHISTYRENEREGYVHICDIDKHIARLVEFRNRAASHFESRNAEWPTLTLSLNITRSPQSSSGHSTAESNPSES
jgi:hypothetical protein